MKTRDRMLTTISMGAGIVLLGSSLLSLVAGRVPVGWRLETALAGAIGLTLIALAFLGIHAINEAEFRQPSELLAEITVSPFSTTVTDPEPVTRQRVVSWPAFDAGRIASPAEAIPLEELPVASME